MPKITMTLNLTESEARALWAHYYSQDTQESVQIPTGQEIADWVAIQAISTLEFEWENDAGVYADIRAGGETDTAELLEQLQVADALLEAADTDSNAPEVAEAKENRALILDALGVSDLPENAEAELAEIVADYKREA